MYGLLSQLQNNHTVLDLGCGKGSFHYDSFPFQTIAADVQLPPDVVAARRHRTQYVVSDSSAIPLTGASVDAVIAHNTLEHFADYRQTLVEVQRVLKPHGWLWIAVPNGYGFDDKLYRYVFEGGGHVNRFTREALISQVETLTSLRLVAACDLFSSFIFLRKPTPEEAAGYPRRAHFLAGISPEFLSTTVVALNTATRLVDKYTGSRWSQYGWGLVFAANGSLSSEQLPSYFNVCRKCGSGFSRMHLPESTKSFFGIRPYHCPGCNEFNLFVDPPAGLD